MGEGYAVRYMQGGWMCLTAHGQKRTTQRERLYIWFSCVPSSSYHSDGCLPYDYWKAVEGTAPRVTKGIGMCI